MPERSLPERRNGLHRRHATSGPPRDRPTRGHDRIGAVDPLATVDLLATRWAVPSHSNMGSDL